MSVAIVFQVPLLCTAYWNWTEATPEPESFELELTVIVPPVVPAAGEVSEPVGAVTSFVYVRVVGVVLPALSAPVIVSVGELAVPLFQVKVPEV